MRRILIFLIAMLLPLSVWAMTPVTDSDLSNVTGQAGVNINANLTMDVSIGTMAWGDADGLASAYNLWDANGTGSNYGDSGGYVGMSRFNITNLAITARIADSWGGYSTLMLKPITIDVATAGASGIVGKTAASYGPADAINSLGGVTTENILAGKTFVRFGLGALLITMDSLNFDVSLAPRVTTTATAGSTPLNMTYGDTTGVGQNLGEVSLGKMVVAINPWSYVDIYQSQSGGATHSASGVAFAVNVTIDHFAMDYMSWGDKDGLDTGNSSTQTAGGNTATTTWFGTDTDAGYIGLNQFMINGPIAINGTVAIDIATIRSGAYAQVPPFWNLLTNTYGGNFLIQTNFVKFMENLALTIPSTRYSTAGLGTALDTAYSLVMSHALSTYSAEYAELEPYLGLSAARDLIFDKYIMTHSGNADVVDLYSRVYAYASRIYTNGLNLGTYGYVLVPTTLVHIAFPTNFIIDVRGSITGDVVLAAAKDLASTTGAGTVEKKSLGDIYLQGMVANIHSGSWIDIWAH